jgi:hypothetical protein
MAVSCKVGTFTIDTTKTAGQDQAVTGVGFQGKVGIFWWSGTTSATDATTAETLRGGIGFAVSSSQRTWATNISLDAQASSASGGGVGDDACIVLMSDASTVEGKADFKQWDSDGFTLTIDDQFATAYIVSYMILGGTDLTNYYTAVETSATTATTKATTGVGFQPTFAMWAVGRLNTTKNVVASNGNLSVGFSVGTAAGSEYSLVGATRNARLTMDTDRYLFDNESIGMMSAGDITYRAELTSFDADGFTLNWLESGGSAIYFAYLALRGPTFTVGDLLTQTDTSTTVTETTTSTPRGIFLMSHNTTKSTQNTTQNSNSVSIGAADSTSSRVAQGWWDENGTADSETATSIEYDGIYTRIASDDTLVGVGDISAIGSTSFTFVMDDADPDQAFAAWWAIQDAPAATVKPWYTLWN